MTKVADPAHLLIILSWPGPCASAEELHMAIREHSETEAFVVKTEMTCYAHIRKEEMVLRPELFTLNGVIHNEKLKNLLIPLDGEDASSSLTAADLSTNARKYDHRSH